MNEAFSPFKIYNELAQQVHVFAAYAHILGKELESMTDLTDLERGQIAQTMLQSLITETTDLADSIKFY